MATFPRILLLQLVVTFSTLTGFGECGGASVAHILDGDLVGHTTTTTCATLDNLLSLNDPSKNVFDKVTFSVHRNGEPEPCGVGTSSVKSLEKALRTFNACASSDWSKFETETFLTNWMESLVKEAECSTMDNDTAPEGLFGYCDMGPARTVIQPDHKDLIPTHSGSLPCRFYTREGVRITSLQQLTSLVENAVTHTNQTQSCGDDQEHPLDHPTCSVLEPMVHLYAVPAGRVFMFAPSFVGEKFVLDHVSESVGDDIVLEVVSLEPRIFEIYDFFTRYEADALIDKALKDTSDVYGLHRSTTGATKGQIFRKRTSDNAWDTSGPVSSGIKRRCLQVLGMDEYRESHTDGLQILRYQNAQAYTEHPDYLSDQRLDNYDYRSEGKGGNRFATILMYMSDVGENGGGETMFKHAWPAGTAESDRVSTDEAIRQLRELPEASILKPGSWEEEMAAHCRTRLAVKPRKGRAVLFYSQYPNGEHDKSVLHGGCPVLNGTKWAANLWVWNGPRPEYENAPMKDESLGYVLKPNEPQPATGVSAIFHNTGRDKAFQLGKLYWKDQLFGDFGVGKSIAVNTFEGHEWSVKVGDDVLATFVVSGEEKQEFHV